MADAGAVDTLRTDSGEALFRLCSEEHHHHLVCRRCGATVEIEAPEDESWVSALADRHGFTDVEHVLEVFGTCGGCSDPDA